MIKLAEPYSGPIHTHLPDFMAGLKSISHPVTRGSYLTKHMASPEFQSALSAHPQSSRIRSSIMGYLNSKSNMVGSVAKTAAVSMSSFFDELEKISGILQRLGGTKRARDSIIAMRAASKIQGMSDKINPHDLVRHQPSRPPAIVQPAPLQKSASGADPAWHMAADLAGLGVLALPTIQKIRRKKMSPKAEHAAELGGLGLLAAPVIHKIISRARGH